MSTKQLATDLRAARALLVRRGWTQGCMGRTASGDPILYTGYLHDLAASLCMGGACAVVAPLCEENDRYFFATQALREAAGTEALANWNDAPGRTLDEVLELFDRAISRADGGAGEKAEVGR